MMYLKNKRVKTHIMQVWIIRARHKRAISIGVGRGLTWPFGTHHVDDRVWNTWVCAYAKYSRPTRGARRESGLCISRRNAELVDIYQQNSPYVR
jgi:hypothetical protein